MHRLKVLGHAAVTQLINFPVYKKLGHVIEMVIYLPITIRYLFCVVDREQHQRVGLCYVALCSELRFPDEYVKLSKTHVGPFVSVELRVVGVH